MNIRAISKSEHMLVRQLRLAALRDAPEAFAEREKDAAVQDEAYWIDLTRSLTSTHIMFVAERNGKTCGSIYGLRDEIILDGARVGGMWVTSGCRGQGIGTALLAAVIQWAQSEGFSTVRLWVPADSLHAQSLYSKNGFVFTGQTKSERGEALFTVREMLLELK